MRRNAHFDQYVQIINGDEKLSSQSLLEQQVQYLLSNKQGAPVEQRISATQAYPPFFSVESLSLSLSFVFPSSQFPTPLYQCLRIGLIRLCFVFTFLSTPIGARDPVFVTRAPRIITKKKKRENEPTMARQPVRRLAVRANNSHHSRTFYEI